MQKWIVLLLRTNSLLRILGYLSLLNWIGVLTLSLLIKIASMKFEDLIRSIKFLHCIPYDLTWNTAVMSGQLPLSRYLEILDKLQKQICRTVSPLLAALLEPLAHGRNLASLSLLYRYFFGRCSSELAQLVPLPYSQGRSSRCSNRLPGFSVIFPRCYEDAYVNNFFPCTSRLWNYLEYPEIKLNELYVSSCRDFFY